MILDHIIYQDDDIIALNKPGGLLSVPGVRNKDSAYSRLAEEVGELHIVHRLDQDTSGIIVYARHKDALRFLQQQFERRLTSKTYEAVVEGELQASGGCINLPIKVDWPNRPLQMISHSEGRYALTRWTRTGFEADKRTRVDLFPNTGRSHQLRIHMQQIGHPIIGDTFYHPDYPRGQIIQMCLHARELGFTHPSSGEFMALRCEAPF
ncbi:MAG: RluA family pseudouridine synthase [Oceanobacter sp.]